MEYFISALMKVSVNIAFAIVTAIVGFSLIKLIMHLFLKSRLYKKMEDSTAAFTKSLLSITLKILLIFILAAMVGIPTASLIALLGSAGLAIGLALQGSLSNFAGGFMILLFKPFKVGDFISISDSTSGTVTDISIFYTTLKTPDNKKIVIPNGQVSNAAVTNTTALEKRRVDVEFCVSYGSDISTVKEVLINSLKDNPLVLHDPEPFVGMIRMDDSCLVFSLKVWCETSNYWDTFFSVSENGKEALDKANIEIPYPKLDVNISK